MDLTVGSAGEEEVGGVVVLAINKSAFVGQDIDRGRCSHSRKKARSLGEVDIWSRRHLSTGVSTNYKTIIGRQMPTAQTASRCARLNHATTSPGFSLCQISAIEGVDDVDEEG